MCHASLLTVLHYAHITPSLIHSDQIQRKLNLRCRLSHFSLHFKNILILHLSVTAGLKHRMKSLLQSIILTPLQSVFFKCSFIQRVLRLNKLLFM